MNNKMKRLELENRLSQAYSNDYSYDGPFCSFDFNNVSFITLNSLDIYIDHFSVKFRSDYLVVSLETAIIEIKYRNIDYLLINFREDLDVS